MKLLVILIFCLIWGVVNSATTAGVKTEKRRNLRCFANNRWIKSGKSFNYQFGHDPCIYKCRCDVKIKDGNKSAVATCLHQCPRFNYPYGCEPVTDGCCAVSYKCPHGERCKDKITGMEYGVNDTWALNSTCECTCLGKGKGIYQCRCTQPKPKFAAIRQVPTFENPCKYDDSISCSACPMGMERCPIRAKCEKYPYRYESMNLQCTCYGKVGTRCLSVKSKNSKKKRMTRSISGLKSGEYIYLSEGDRKENEPIFLQISV